MNELIVDRQDADPVQVLSAKKTLLENITPYVVPGTKVVLDDIHSLWWSEDDGTWTVALSVVPIYMSSFFLVIMGDDDDAVIVYYTHDNYSCVKKIQ